MMKWYDWSLVATKLRFLGKLTLWLLGALLVGSFIGCGVASKNPFAIFDPNSWLHLIEFLS